MSQEELVKFIKLQLQEYGTTLETLRQSEEKALIAKQAEKALNSTIENLQAQLKELVKENTKMNASNYELKSRIEQLKKENETYKQNESKMKLMLERMSKEVMELQDEAKQSDQTILEYEKDFDEFEKEAEETNNKIEEAEKKIIKLEELVKKLTQEIKEARSETETVALEKASSLNTFTQEKLELKKTICISEKTISYLSKEKTTLETKISFLQKSLDKFNKNMESKEAQTDNAEYVKEEVIAILEEKLAKKEEELKKVNGCSSSLFEEIRKLQEKVTVLQTKNFTLQETVNGNANKLKEVEGERSLLAVENKDLKRRRERAKSEIKKLQNEITRSKSKSRTNVFSHSLSITSVTFINEFRLVKVETSNLQTKIKNSYGN